MDAPKLLVVCERKAPFVDLDARLLASHYDVATFAYRGRRDAWRLLLAARNSDALLCWFATDGAALALAASGRRPSVVIVGGYEVAQDTDVPGYGRRRMLEKAVTRYALGRAGAVCPVSPFTERETRAWIDRAMTVVPNAVDVRRFRPGARPNDPHRVVAVATGGASAARLKGVPRVLAAARRAPSLSFDIIGFDDRDVAVLERDLGAAPRNVAWLPSVPHTDLPGILQGAGVVVQLSLRESFAIGLAEAVACGCVPVYSNQRIGVAPYLEPLGFGVPAHDPDAVAAALQQASRRAGPDFARRAHTHVSRRLAPERRKAALLAALAAQGSPSGKD